MFVDGRMEKQSVVYTYSGILLSLQKEGDSDMCYNMHELDDMPNEQNPVPKDRY